MKTSCSISWGVVWTRHDGSISTGHANSAEDMLARLETMVLMGIDLPLPAIRRQIASSVDLVIHLGRLRDKSRKLLKISEVKGMEQGEITLNTLFEYKERGVERGKVLGELRKINELLHIEKLQSAGLLDLYREMQHGLPCV